MFNISHFCCIISTKRNENKEEIDFISLATSFYAKMLQRKKDDYSLELSKKGDSRLIKLENLNVRKGGDNQAVGYRFGINVRSANEAFASDPRKISLLGFRDYEFDKIENIKNC